MEVIHQQLDGELIFQTGPQHMINSVRKVSSNCWESRTKQVKRRFNIIQMSNGCPGNLLRQASHASDEGDDQVDKAQGKTWVWDLTNNATEISGRTKALQFIKVQ